ncbi:MAG: hypothetical protein IMF11_13700 [Proteobacteria bacterium]|nr:hypothetical protein [Pseudomonadota bacterium]MCK4487185.1 hypothetical protein [Desulfobacterales bacterium]
MWEDLDIGGYVRGEIHVPAFAEEETETSLGCTMQLKASAVFSESLSAFAELRNRMEHLKDICMDSDFDLREGYLSFRGARLDITIGEQVIARGQADTINPTDNLCARDKTIFSSEPDDQRLGAFATKMDVYVGDFTITGVWQPDFTHSEFLVPPLAPEIKIEDPELPSKEISSSAWALKCATYFHGTDISLSYFYGYCTYPDLILKEVFVQPRLEIRILPVFVSFRQA